MKKNKKRRTEKAESRERRGAPAEPLRQNERKTGLARALSKLGYCSRSQAGELIRAGHVRLNGTLRRDPETPVHLGRDRVEVDGEEVRAEARVYVMLNKPRGIVTTAATRRTAIRSMGCCRRDCRGWRRWGGWTWLPRVCCC